MTMEESKDESFDMAECSDLHHREMKDCITKGFALNSLLYELLEEKVSTQKKHHWILGHEDLNDTLVYDFDVEEAA